jgi:DNA recombination protein RmuC
MFMIIAAGVAACALLALGALVGWLAAHPAVARLQTELVMERAVHAERVRSHEEGQAKLRDTFQALTADALKTSNEIFLQLAESRLREVRTEAAADLDSRRSAIENLLAPMKTTLDQVDREIKESERRRIETGAELIQKIASLDTVGQTLRSETSRLVDALRRPSVRGRWGELQLKRAVELAGMVEHCHFSEQQTIETDDGRIRPDVIVRLPGGKHVVIDAKAPLDAYLRALDTPDETARARLLADHAKRVRAHLTELAAKNYAASIQPGPDFVIMFLPGEMFFSAALEQDPELIEYGVEKRVIPASPTTLIALLRAVAYGWQQEALSRDARQIGDLGRRLYESVGRLADRFDRLGSRLRASIDAYNDAVGALEGGVLTKARRFKDFHLGGDDDLDALEPIHRIPRILQAPELTAGLRSGHAAGSNGLEAADAEPSRVPVRTAETA